MKTTANTIDPRFEVRESRPGTGLGLFALAPIKKGDFILEYVGKKVPTATADESDSRYLFEIDDEWTVEGPPEINLAGYINHACEPSVEAEIEQGADGLGHIMIYALRDIERGEELSIDYGEEYFDEFIKPTGCRCAGCMGKAVLQETL